MSTIIYGNLRAEIAGDAGVRLSRLALRQPASGLLRPGQPSAPHRPRLLGLETEIADALAAVQAGRPAGFVPPADTARRRCLRPSRPFSSTNRAHWRSATTSSTRPAGCSGRR